MSELGERNVSCNKVLDLMAKGFRSKAIRKMYEVMDEYGDFGLRERLDSARDDYNRMVEYWGNGVQDPGFDNVSERNRKVIADLVSEYTTRAMNTEDSCYLLTLDKIANKKNHSWDWNDVKHKLESLMSDEAVAGLDFDGSGKERLYRLVDKHYEYQKRLFNHTVCLGLLNHDDTELIKQLLASPTVDASDLQMLVTALSLSGCRAFDIRKFEIMAYACRYGVDMKVRQRAIVGLMLTMGYNMFKHYPEQKTILADLLADEEICSQLVELQMQLIYCVKAIDDSGIMTNEIMPNMMKSSKFKITKNGIEEIEEDPMDDILGENSAEKSAEETEQLVDRVNAMRDAGSDLFFLGFSQMKRGPFFNEMANWFIAFNPMHKSVRSLTDGSDGMDLIQMMSNSTPLCDSDKYSFVFVLGEMVRHMPKSMIDQFKATGRFSHNNQPEDKTPTLYRRNYLQSLYRFFKLFKWRNGLLSPFEHYEDGISDGTGYRPTYLFSIEQLFVETDWYNREQPRLSLFMAKNMCEQLRDDLIGSKLKTVDSYEGKMAGAKLMLKLKMPHNAISMLYAALRHKPDSLIAKKLLGRELVDINPAEAARLLLDVVNADESNPQNLYTIALAFFHGQLYEKAMTTLFELEYKYPDNLRVKCLLGVILFLRNDIDRAYPMLQKGIDGYDDTLLCPFALILSCWIKTHSAKEILRLTKEKRISLLGIYVFENSMYREGFFKVIADNGISKEDLDMLGDLSEKLRE